jgi:hypothetical protein
MLLSRETLAAGVASSLRERSEAIQKAKNWIASSQELLAMTKV